jgi:effector-binding domain-containing protein
MHPRHLLPVLLFLLFPSCFSLSGESDSVDSASPSALPATTSSGRSFTFQPDLEISRPPFTKVNANWKQRLDQPYIFVEYVGSYVQTGRLLPMVQQAMLEQGIEASGAPFCLFFDDPGKVPSDELRSRACIPVDSPELPDGELTYDVLPSTTVAYAYASGAYPEVPCCYPGLYTYLGKMGWVEDGPIRETYLVSPADVKDFAALLTEVQIPVSFGR